MHSRANSSTPLARIAQTQWLSAPQEMAALTAVRFVSAAYPVPTAFSQPMMAHLLAPSLPAPADLHRLVTRLRGKLVVTNPVGAARMDAILGEATRALVRGALSRSLRLPDGAELTSSLLRPEPSAAPFRLPAAADARASRERRHLALLIEGASPHVRD